MECWRIFLVTPYRRMTAPASTEFFLAVLSVVVLALAAPAATWAVPEKLGQAAGLAPRLAPELIFEAPDSLRGEVERLESLDPKDLARMTALLGLEDPGPPIRVQLVAEGSPEARRAPSWSVAYAFGAAGYVVLMPSRVPAYPDHHLVGVLRHEVAHVLIARAAGRRPVPRWFNEGLALVAAREWNLEDRSRLVLVNLRRGAFDLEALDRRFQGGHHSAASAYTLSGAFVRYLVAEHGERAIARILRRVARDESFEDAVQQALGVSLTELFHGYVRHLNLWHKWVPVLSSTTVLWFLISLLAVVAFKRRRDRDREILEKWDEEERQRLLALPGDGWVH